VIVLRGIMIGFGAALVSRFDWVLYIFGAFLIVTGIKMLVMGDTAPRIEDNKVLGFLRNSVGSRGGISLLEDVAQRLRPPLEIGQNPLPVALLVVGGTGIGIVHPMA